MFVFCLSASPRNARQVGTLYLRDKREGTPDSESREIGEYNKKPGGSLKNVCSTDYCPGGTRAYLPPSSAPDLIHGKRIMDHRSTPLTFTHHTPTPVAWQRTCGTYQVKREFKLHVQRTEYYSLQRASTTLLHGVVSVRAEGMSRCLFAMYILYLPQPKVGRSPRRWEARRSFTGRGLWIGP